ncbi:putative transcriptional regulator [Hoeflea phototrophica DFL-43]|uniref:Putative transcriptional regulator n=1 Tax=Hoeflea phototrophica (strain DSM 17068 / NCIMB 14078 / DFL-43) TaxID=411684 RepID=A9D6D9_HOEPD|nr:helix-turn-helix transcriptional regulator [Hoeflea phototrophica]EDQ33475.1 putative transcriptional regulator [Hoeflea phototrophica DFL-43]
MIEPFADDAAAGHRYTEGMSSNPTTPPANAVTISSIAALIGDPARANILSALMGGKALTAGELAFCAHITPQTASSHLAKLLDGQLVAVEKQGRHRYFRLASVAVAEAFESLSGLAAAGPARQRTTGPRDVSMRRARTCYDHMAGTLAVAITDSLVDRGVVVIEDRSGLITEDGSRFLSGIGITFKARTGSARPLCRTCLDWSERRMHLGGQLGASLLTKSLEQNWVRAAGDDRALTITRSGEHAFHKIFGLGTDLIWRP